MALTNLEKIKVDVDDALWNGTMADRQDAADELMAYLTGEGQSMARSDAKEYDQLVRQWVLLSYRAFVVLPLDEQQELLKTRLLVAVQSGYHVEEFTDAYFDMYESDDFLAPIFSDYANMVMQNIEPIGFSSVEVEGAKYLPQVRYWVLDYSKSPSQSARRTSIDRLNYTNSSLNARQLTQIQRTHLLEILKLYDLLVVCERPAPKNDTSNGASSPERTAPPQAPTPVAAVAATPVTPAVPAAPQLSPIEQQIDEKLNELERRVEGTP